VYRYEVYNYTEKRRVIFTLENHFSGDYSVAFEKFIHFYSPDTIVPHPDKKLLLRKRSERMCRFCYEVEPKVTFKNVAHIMPQLMGNRYLIHDSECDTCNKKFGIYEDSFAKFLGMMRTADAMKGQSGVPNFKSADGKLIMAVEKDEKGMDVVSVFDKGGAEYRENEKSIVLTAIKPSYIPLHVMKCFYKIGYSLLDPTELEDYPSLRQIITSGMFDTKLGNFAKAVKFTLPVYNPTPLVVTYKKKEEHSNEHLPSKIVVIYFGRYVYQFFLINIQDKFMFTEGEKCEWIITPPYYRGKQEDIFGERIDLSSNVLKKGELDSAVFTFDDI